MRLDIAVIVCARSVFQLCRALSFVSCSALGMSKYVYPQIQLMKTRSPLNFVYHTRLSEAFCQPVAYKACGP